MDRRKWCVHVGKPFVAAEETRPTPVSQPKGESRYGSMPKLRKNSIELRDRGRMEVANAINDDFAWRLKPPIATLVSSIFQRCLRPNTLRERHRSMLTATNVQPA